VGSAFAIVRRARSHICIQLNVKSQLIVIHLRRLQQTTDLHGSLTLLFLRRLRSLLTLLEEQLSVIPRELLQGNQEVAQNDLEAVEVGVGREKSVNKRCDLSTLNSQ
jgi:hypothetical protein